MGENSLANPVQSQPELVVTGAIPFKSSYFFLNLPRDFFYILFQQICIISLDDPRVIGGNIFFFMKVFFCLKLHDMRLLHGEGKKEFRRLVFTALLEIFGVYI